MGKNRKNKKHGSFVSNVISTIAKKTEPKFELVNGETLYAAKEFAEFSELEALMMMTQKQVGEYVKAELKKLYPAILCSDKFIFAMGDYPVMLCAHMDTVYSEPVKHIAVSKNEKGESVLRSPQGIGGDDRCGIHMILTILRGQEEGKRCSVVFLEDEEIGCIGAHRFSVAIEEKKIKKPDVNYIIEFDRKGSRDAVYYDCDNMEFEDFVTEMSEYFVTNYGTCSDISYIAPAMGVAAVNLSCGYYDEHRKEKETVNVAEMRRSIEAAIKLINSPCEKPFEYIDYYESHMSDRWGGWNAYGDITTRYNYYDNYNTYAPKKENKKKLYSVYFTDEGEEQYYCHYVYANSEAEAMGRTVIDEMEYDWLSYKYVLAITEEKNIDESCADVVTWSDDIHNDMGDGKYAII